MRMLRSLGFLLLAGVLLGIPAVSQAQIAVGISVHIGPPVLPLYAQPVCPGPGYIWTPGYWAWSEDTGGYYWVPGTWVIAPEPGFLWTPGYWGFSEGVYFWHAGYWGPHVGFYGGINYGYGYTGVGFWGGEWRGREFVYNRSVTNINTTVINNYYNRTVVVNNTTVNNASYNGGPHGIQARPSERDRIAEHDRHIEARHEQIEHDHAARTDRRQWASENHGRPAVAASGRPGDFHRDVVAAREASHREAVRPDRPEHGADNRGFGRNDRPSNDRPSNMGGRDRENGKLSGNDRPNNSHVDNRRNDRPVQDSRGHGPDPRGEARGNPRVDHSSAPVERGKPSYDRGPAPRAVDHAAPPQHGPDHGSAAHGNGNGSGGRAESKPEEHGKDRGKP